VALEHDYFGLIEEQPGGGLYWSESVEVGDQYVDLSMSVPRGEGVSDEDLDIAAALLQALEGLDLRAREDMLSAVDDRESDVSVFVVQAVEEYGDGIEDLFVDHSGDLDVDLIRSLVLTRVAVHPSASSDTEAFVDLEFALDPDGSDLALLVSLSRSVTPVSIIIVE